MTTSPDVIPRNIENIIPILIVGDFSASLEYYQKVLSFTVEWSGEDFAGLSRDGWRLYLSQDGEAQPGARLWVGVEDVDRMYEECRTKGANIVSGMTSNPWAREVLVADPDGNLLRFGGEPEADSD